MRCLALAAASLGLVVLGTQSLPVMAQTETAQADTRGTLRVATKAAAFANKAEEAGIAQAFALLRNALAEDEVTQPAQAIAQYEAFFNLKGKRSVRVGIAISSLIAKLYWLELHQPQKAQATYDWAIATYRNQPGFERLYLEEQLLQNPKSLDVKQVKASPNLKAPLVPDAVKVASQVQAKAAGAVATVKSVVVGGAPVAFGVPLVATVTMPKPDRALVAQVGGTQTATTTRTTNVGEVKSPAFGTKQGKTLEVATVSGRPLLLAALVEQMRAGMLTPEAAWKNGSLTVDDAMQLLNQSGDWIVNDVRHDNGMYRGLAKLLVEHGSEKLKDVRQAPPKVRLWLADYFQVNKDKRAVDWSESILSEVKTPVKGENPLVFQAIERLAWYYGDVGQAEKGAEAYLRTEKLFNDAGWWLPDALLESARLLSIAGKKERSTQLYARVSNYAQDSITILALLDQADAFMQSNKHEEARLLMQKTMNEPNRYIQVAALALLSFSYYRTSDFDTARQHGQKALAIYKSLGFQLDSRDRLQLFASRAQQSLLYIEQWSKAPLACEPKELRITVNRGQLQSKPVTQEIAIRSFRHFWVVITSDNPDLKVRMLNNEEVQDNGFYFEQKVAVEVSRESTQKGFDAILLVSSPLFSSFSVRVPVHVQFQDPNS